MAGHSKWANIQHRKAAVDAKRGKAFAKVSREIMVAVKEGGSDPNYNFSLLSKLPTNYPKNQENVQKTNENTGVPPYFRKK